ncbi:nucleotide sugar dehydrogenase [Oceanibium sediminis]|uniref:nucleotide sugar dehydrogenase n=1 Tax=Oceanibium sediminis TaxID=2026339 RepID=UPI00280B01E0|nr:nucleotide sugar dehydrogenase [Oceanibium sediminis]
MTLLESIASRRAKIGVIGLGYVGIPLARRICESGFPVMGFDIQEERIFQLDRGESPIKNVADTDIAAMKAAGFYATTDIARAAECDALIICVPTPLSAAREPNLEFVESTMAGLSKHIRAGQIIVLESTTWPGTTRLVLAPYLEAEGHVIGQDVHLAYSPEREDPGNPNYTTRTIPKVVGGATPRCLEVAEELYGSFIDQVVPVSSADTAEMVKLLENIHRSVNIGLVNELKTVADAMGIDIYEVIAAASTKPFGFTAYYPGPGIGGHCIPVDPFYLTWRARQFGLSTRFIELSGEINAAMPQYVVGKTVRALSDARKPVRGARILILGIAYKPGVDDTRESPSIFVMELLRNWGARIDYSDPHVPCFPPMRDHHFDLASVTLSPEVIAGYDAVLLLTAHAEFDYSQIEEHAQLIIDTRGKIADGARVVRA